VFKNGPSLKELRKRKHSQTVNKENEDYEWYKTFQTLWKHVEDKIEVNCSEFSLILFNLFENLSENSIGKLRKSSLESPEFHKQHRLRGQPESQDRSASHRNQPDRPPKAV
jgi:hypothetical protein